MKPEPLKDNNIVLTDDSLDRCMNCGNRFNTKDVYDFYCSDKCEKEDKERIIRMVDKGHHPTTIMNEALEKVSEPRCD